jgi:hypothetical protein
MVGSSRERSSSSGYSYILCKVLGKRLRNGLLGEYATVQAQSDPREERREDS